MKQVSTDWRSLHGDAFRGRRVLVTGGAGFIGSHLAGALAALGAEVRVLDDLSGGERANVAGVAGVNFTEGSILDKALLADCVAGCDCVFHQAALGSVPHSLEMPERYYEVNATGTLNVLEAARHGGVRRVMFAASSSAYGDTERLPNSEDMPTDPRSPYAATKTAGESLMKAYAAGYGLDTVSLRYFNIFGPRQNPNSAYAAVIAAFAKGALEGTALRIYGDGEQSRDFTYVDNAVQANLLAARADGPLAGRVLNVACGRRVSVNELAQAVLEVLTRRELAIEHAAPRAGDVKHSLADLERTREALGYEPLVDFRDGLEATLCWYAQTAGQPSS